jgi:hypothetical protein
VELHHKRDSPQPWRSRDVLASVKRSALPIAIVAAALAAAAPAAARPASFVAPEPWATVNLCDTADHPNEIGIRGAMPGLARTTRMSMRFRVQFKDADGKWRAISSGADSGWQHVAIGRRGMHDAGWTFEFEPPPAASGAYVLRGVVQFQWRRSGHAVRRERKTTQAGHPGTAGADPDDYTAATCAIA